MISLCLLLYVLIKYISMDIATENVIVSVNKTKAISYISTNNSTNTCSTACTINKKDMSNT